MGRQTIEQRYRDAIANMPKRGTGLHQHLPRITNYAVMLGLSCEQAEYDINTGNPSTAKDLKRNEIKNAYAFSSRSVKPMDFNQPVRRDPYARYTQSVKAVSDPVKLKPQDIAVEATLMDIMEASPVRLLEDPRLDGYRMLECLYQSDEYVFIGDTYSKSENVLQVSEWMNKDITPYPFIMCNPLTGLYGFTSDGKESKRCEQSVKEGRYLLLEMDETPRDEQINIIMGMIERNYPVALVVDSGNKSLHTWINVNCPKEHWTERVREKIFEGTLSEFGIDPACKNISRLSRLGGHLREKTNKTQNIYYLKEF